MIKRLIILPIIFFCSQALRQVLESVVVQTWMHDEPPTESGTHILEIQYDRNEQGDYDAHFYSRYSRKSKKVNLKADERLEKEEVLTFLEWSNNSKTTFKLSELGTDHEELGLSVSSAPYKPNFPVENNFLVKIDSFAFCNEYQFRRSISTGGYTIKILLIQDGHKTEFLSYNSDDRGQHKFDLQGYLCIQPVLENKVPEEFGVGDFFSRETLLNNLLYYKKVIECEGYYYQEFIQLNPERSIQSNRMMIGWDFKKYLEQRSIK